MRRYMRENKIIVSLIAIILAILLFFIYLNLTVNNVSFKLLKSNTKFYKYGTDTNYSIEIDSKAKGKVTSDDEYITNFDWNTGWNESVDVLIKFNFIADDVTKLHSDYEKLQYINLFGRNMRYYIENDRVILLYRYDEGLYMKGVIKTGSTCKRLSTYCEEKTVSAEGIVKSEKFKKVMNLKVAREWD